jgi:AcrR family transcriptional regulator
VAPSTESSSPEPGARRYGAKTTEERRRERRERLLDAGLELFATQGYAGTRIEELCARARVSTRSFYEEFASREALVIALHDAVNARALEGVVAALAPVAPDDLLARARAATRAYLDVMTADRRWARIALVESVGVSPAAEAHRRAAIDRFVAVIEIEARRLAGAGVLPDRDFHLTAVALAGALNGLVNTWTAVEEWAEVVPAIAEEAAQLIALALRRG